MSKEVMQSEWIRISSFAHFPLESPVHTLKLAEAGFYYQNKSDEVTCFSCGRKYSGWKTGDDPIRIHRNISPHCRFIIGNKSGNITVKQNGESFFSKIESLINSVEKNPPSDNSKGACGGNAENVQNNSTSKVDNKQSRNPPVSRNTLQEKSLVCQDDSRDFILKPSSNKNQQSETTSYEPLGITTQHPVYPQYAITVVRMSSFRHWPKDKKQHPQDLAKAGFFYEGKYTSFCFLAAGVFWGHCLTHNYL